MSCLDRCGAMFLKFFGSLPGVTALWALAFALVIHVFFTSWPDVRLPLPTQTGAASHAED